MKSQNQIRQKRQEVRKAQNKSDEHFKDLTFLEEAKKFAWLKGYEEALKWVLYR